MSNEPPFDLELKEIIDKLAVFVAKNGKEFEQRTMDKQRDNPRFAFLFNGQHSGYYQQRVAEEINNLGSNEVQQKSRASRWGDTGGSDNISTKNITLQPGETANSLNKQLESALKSLSDRQMSEGQLIQQSESNLDAQYKVIMSKKDKDIGELKQLLWHDKTVQLFSGTELSLEDLDAILSPITQNCTKENINTGKTFVIEKTDPSQPNYINTIEGISLYLLKTVTGSDITFEHKLHVVYLINDIYHHCIRKDMNALRAGLQQPLLIGFASLSSMLHTDEKASERRPRLDKLLSIWERHKFFDEEKLNTLKKAPDSFLQTLNEDSELNARAEEISQAAEDSYNAMAKQNNDYKAHVESQWANLTEEIAVLRQKIELASAQSDSNEQGDMKRERPSRFGPPPTSNTGNMENVSRFDSGPPVSMPERVPFPPFPRGFPPPERPIGMPDLSRPPPGFGPPMMFMGGPPRPGFGPPFMPGMRPGFPPLGAPRPMGRNQAVPEAEGPRPEDPPMSSLPYYDLPAGLMCPLVGLDESDYKALDPKLIRLPAPVPPSERLIAAVEQYYGPPSHDTPRDADGWERLGLYEFYRAKKQAKEKKQRKRLKKQARKIRKQIKKQRKEQDQSSRNSSGSRSRSSSSSSHSSSSSSSSDSSSEDEAPMPEANEQEKEEINEVKKEPEQMEEQAPPEPEVKAEPIKRRFRDSPVKQEAAARAPDSSPKRRRRSRSRSRERHRSPKRRRPSVSPPRRRRPVSRERSLTPPMMATVQTGVHVPLGMDNVGAQLMSKMGWQGGGLGQNEKGRTAPIDLGEVREKSEQYRGVGVSTGTDPFEKFRRSSSNRYVDKIRQKGGNR